MLQLDRERPMICLSRDGLRSYWIERAMMRADSGNFHTTQWSDIHKARTMDTTRQRDAIDGLTRQYWMPVYSFLRRKGYDHADAADLTQGFFHEIVLERHLFQQADQRKGRFRTYLLCSLHRYAAEQHRRRNARKRMPAATLIHLGPSNLQEMIAAQATGDPDQVFQYSWAVNLLDKALHCMEREYCEDGKAHYWQIFQERVVDPILNDSPPPSLSTLCKKYGIDTEKKASNLIITVKRRFQTILKRVLTETMEPNACVEDELAELISILSQGNAAS